MIYLHRLIEYLIIPPSSSLVLIVLGLVLLLRWKWLGRGLVILGLASLYLASTPAFVTPIMESWISRYPMVDLKNQDAQAIVVLGGGRRERAYEYGVDTGDTVNRFAMERLRYAAHIHRQTGLPILVTGGVVYEDDRESEAVLMTRFLEELGVMTRWQEDQSRTSFENAQYSVPMLKEAGVNRVLLVTHGVHMPRSVWSFQNQGMEVIAAPTVFHTYGSRGGVKDYVPQAATLYGFTQILHEWLGLAWYRLSKS
jgi:uncharacterized SAM-binding protein YcdF (DUF218 family)